MQDKNGIEIKTGDIVEITGAYFKRHNGTYFVDCSPGDPNWCSPDYSLIKISRAGKISSAKYNLCSWPIRVYVSSREQCKAADLWNSARASIEIRTIPNMAEVAEHFQKQADHISSLIDRRMRFDFGEDSDIVKKNRAIAAHYAAVAQRVSEG